MCYHLVSQMVCYHLVSQMMCYHLVSQMVCYHLVSQMMVLLKAMSSMCRICTVHFPDHISFHSVAIFRFYLILLFAFKHSYFFSSLAVVSILVLQ